jgi:hypothetical protein
MINEGITWVDNPSTVCISDRVISGLSLIPSTDYLLQAALGRAVTYTVNKFAHDDVTSAGAVGFYQHPGYLFLVLRWPSGAQVETHQIIRETLKPFRYQMAETFNRLCIIFQNHHAAILLCRPFDSTAMVPVGSPAFVINQQMSANRISQPHSGKAPGVMADHHKLYLCCHQAHSLLIWVVIAIPIFEARFVTDAYLTPSITTSIQSLLLVR